MTTPSACSRSSTSRITAGGGRRFLAPLSSETIHRPSVVGVRDTATAVSVPSVPRWIASTTARRPRATSASLVVAQFFIRAPSSAYSAAVRSGRMPSAARIGVGKRSARSRALRANVFITPPDWRSDCLMASTRSESSAVETHDLIRYRMALAAATRFGVLVASRTSGQTSIGSRFMTASIVSDRILLAYRRAWVLRPR